MTKLYTISGKLLFNCKQIYFFTRSDYDVKLLEILNKYRQAFCYRVNIPERFITRNLNDQQQNKILKIDALNKNQFKYLNYVEKYVDDINYDCPYPLYYPCNRLLMKNFDGVDATSYNKKYIGENLNNEGLIWNVNYNIKLELIDYHPIQDSSS